MNNPEWTYEEYLETQREQALVEAAEIETFRELNGFKEPGEI